MVARPTGDVLVVSPDFQRLAVEEHALDVPEQLQGEARIVAPRVPVPDLDPEPALAFTKARQRLDDRLGAVEGVAQIEQGKWVAVERENEYLIVVLDAPSDEYAKRLVDACLQRLSQTSF